MTVPRRDEGGMTPRDTPDLRARQIEADLRAALTDEVMQQAINAQRRGWPVSPLDGFRLMRDVLVAALTARPAENTLANLRADETRDSIVMAAETMRELCAQAIERAMRVKGAMTPDASECATIVRNFKIQAPTDQMPTFASGLVAPSVPNGGDSGNLQRIERTEAGAVPIQPVIIDKQGVGYWSSFDSDCISRGHANGLAPASEGV